MKFLSYKNTSVLLIIITLVMSGFMVFASGVEAQEGDQPLDGSADLTGETSGDNSGVSGIDIGGNLSRGAGLDNSDTGICSLSTGLSSGEVESLTGRENISASGARDTVDERKITDLEWASLCTYSLAKLIVNWLSIIVGVIALLMMLYAGFMFIKGGSQGVQSNIPARNILVAAIAGFILVALSQTILQVLKNLIL